MKVAGETASWQKRARAYNYAAMVLMLLALFWPSLNYQFLIMTLMAFPLIGFFIVWQSKGSISFDAPQVSALNNSIVTGSSVAICSLGLRAVLDFNYIKVSPLWLPAASIAAAYWLMVLAVDQDARKVGSAVAQFMFSAAYAVSAVFLSNCVFDTQPGEANINTVMDKRVSLHVKGPPSYELTIAPWRYSLEPSEISVPRETYDQLEVGEPVEIIVKEGFFDAPWIATVRKIPSRPV